MAQNNMILIIISLFIIISFVDYTVFAQEIEQRDKLLTESVDPFFKGEYEKAIRLFDEILENNPNDIKIEHIAKKKLRLKLLIVFCKILNMNINKLTS